MVGTPCCAVVCAKYNKGFAPFLNFGFETNSSKIKYFYSFNQGDVLRTYVYCIPEMGHFEESYTGYSIPCPPLDQQFGD